MASPPAAVSYGRRLAELAALHPDRTAIVFADADRAEHTITWQHLDTRSNQVAHLLLENGVGQGSMVVVALPNTPDHYVAALAAWKVGACVLPLSPTLPPHERDQVLAVADTHLAVADWPDAPVPVLAAADVRASEALTVAALPDRIAQPGKAVASGGSTGRPKVIVDPNPWARVPGAIAHSPLGRMGILPGQVQIVAVRLYHTSPFTWGHWGLFEDHRLVLMERFDAAHFVDLVERHRVELGFLVPTMMQRIARLPGVEGRDFSSVHSFFHSAAPCPPWLKRAFLELVGPEHLNEAYGASEGTGATMIRGDEWLAHPGSVGRPVGCDLRVLDEDGQEVPAGTVGEVFLRPHAVGPVYEYRGSPPARSTDDGFVSVGDMGWVDDDGYLFLADRRADLIVTGGVNVYPAEVEAALTEHPGVADVAVIGLPDEEWGKRVHAIVQPASGAAPPSIDELDAHCRRRLASFKVPKAFELVALLPRDASGKLRRSALVDERAVSDSAPVA